MRSLTSLCVLFSVLILCGSAFAQEKIQVLTNQVGYEQNAAKKAVVLGHQGDGDEVTTFKVLDYNTWKEVLAGNVAASGPVDKWKDWTFWTVDLSPVTTEGTYVIEVATNKGPFRSAPFKVQHDILERNTISGLIYYFKEEGDNGQFEKYDSMLNWANGQTIDLHGGFYDASGDYGVHMGGGNPSAWFAAQQEPESVWALLKADQMLTARDTSPERFYRQFRRRMVDEGLFGADFLVRSHIPGGTFLGGTGGGGYEKLGTERTASGGGGGRGGAARGGAAAAPGAGEVGAPTTRAGRGGRRGGRGAGAAGAVAADGGAAPAAGDGGAAPAAGAPRAGARGAGGRGGGQFNLKTSPTAGGNTTDVAHNEDDRPKPPAKPGVASADGAGNPNIAPGTGGIAFRNGAGLAIAALAVASTLPVDGDYKSIDYLHAAEDAFAAADKQYDAGQPIILDDFSALIAATELAKATKDPQYKAAADKYGAKMLARLMPTGYWRADDNDRPFFHPTDAGMPVVSLLGYYDIADSATQAKILDAVHKAMDYELKVTDEVNNPFGYARQYTQVNGGDRFTTFFFPHNTETNRWWQGENGRIGSLAAAARMTAIKFKQSDPAFYAKLQAYASDQLNWVLGENPFDASMMQGVGRNNIEYGFFGSYEYYPAMGGVDNGMTSGYSTSGLGKLGSEATYDPADNDSIKTGELPSEHEIEWNLKYGQTHENAPDVPPGHKVIDEDWRWGEQWLPHGAWFMYAVTLNDNPQ